LSSPRHLLIFLFLLYLFPVWGQGIPGAGKPGKDKNGKPVPNILPGKGKENPQNLKPQTQGTPINFTSDKADFQKINGKTVGYLRSTGNPCRFFQGNAVMTSDSAVLFQDENKLNAYGHVVIHQADTITITGDRLYYDGNTRKAQLYDHITMTDRQGVLTTDHLNYDLNTKIGTYFDGGRITNKDNILLSRTGYYYESTKVAYFKTKVSILTPQTTITSDTLQYNTVSRIAYFFGPTRIVGKDDFIYCENGEYNTGTDQAKFSRHAYYLNGSKKLTGDSLYYDKKVGYGKAVKNVIFRDSVEKAFLYGGLAVYNKTTEITYATIKPLFIFLTQTQDTLNTYPDSLKNEIPLEKPRKVPNKKHPEASLISPPNPVPLQIKGRIILDTLISLNNEKGKGKKSKKVSTQHLIRSVVDKIDSLYLTADTLKTALVTGDRAKPHLYVKNTPNLKKTRFDSLDKKAVQLLGEIRKDVILDSLKKLPGYKAPLPEKISNLKALDTSMFKSRLPPMNKTGKEMKNPDSLSSRSLLGLKEKKYSNRKSREEKLKNSVRDSVPSLKKTHKGFFARLFGGLFTPEAPSGSSADSLAKRKQDSLNRRARMNIPYLLEGIPGNSEKEWSSLYLVGKKKLIRYEDTAHYRILFAYNKARMYKSDFQSAADSMVFTYYDSTLRYFKKPIVWTEGSQMTSDTLSLSLKNQKLDSLAMIRSAFIISKVDSTIKDKFHQISGRNMFGRFKNNNLTRLLVEGNAKSLYYAEDEKKDTVTGKSPHKIIGMNTTVASYFLIYFKANHPSRINTVENPVSHFYPLKLLSPGKERLSGFYWRDSERPKSKMDIFRRPSPSELAEDTLVNKKSNKLDSLDDSSPNILDTPKPILKKAKPRFSSPPAGPANPKAYYRNKRSFPWKEGWEEIWNRITEFLEINQAGDLVAYINPNPFKRMT
jgi:lipopolysaccharide export system protein LptA